MSQVLNCAVKLPVGVGKLASYLFTNGIIGSNMEALQAVQNMRSNSERLPLNPIVGAFGHEVMNLRIDEERGYRVPNVTDLFTYRHLTKL